MIKKLYRGAGIVRNEVSCYDLTGCTRDPIRNSCSSPHHLPLVFFRWLLSHRHTDLSSSNCFILIHPWVRIPSDPADVLELMLSLICP